MKDGFIKVASVSPDLHVADVAYNTSRILEAVKEGVSRGVQILCFPELSITGYTCGDLFGSDLLVECARAALLKILSDTADLPIFFAVGLPWRYNGKLYNVAVAICSGRLLGLVPKTNVPVYGEFYERRNFTPWNEPSNGQTAYESLGDQVFPISTDLIFDCDCLPGLRIGMEICEDVWVTIPPSSYLAQKGATVILNLSASDELIGKSDFRRQLISSQSAKIVGGYLYANASCGESTTDMVFGGHNLICENGTVLAEAKPFESGYAESELDIFRILSERSRISTFRCDKSAAYSVSFELPVKETVLTRKIERRPFVPENSSDLTDRCAAIVTMQARGLSKRIQHIACRSVIGISGGLDSTLALLVTVKAYDLLGRDRQEILAVTMPGFGTTVRTKSNAELLCEALKVRFLTIPISSSVTQHFQDIGQDPEKRDVTYENAQARERTQILMDLANQNGGIVIGTGDLSELALGWTTYSGDHISMYGVNSSVPKTLVRHLVRYFAQNEKNPIIQGVLEDILATPVSPELLPPEKNGEISQCTEDIIGPYDLHDFFLYYTLRWGFPPHKIYRLAKIAWGDIYSEEVIYHWLSVFILRFFRSQFKRSCLPDGPKIGTVTLSPRGDWRMPSDASASLWIADLQSVKNVSD